MLHEKYRYHYVYDYKKSWPALLLAYQFCSETPIKLYAQTAIKWKKNYNKRSVIFASEPGY